MKKQLLTMALAVLTIGAIAQEKVRVHNGNSNYVTTIEQITFDVTDADQAISVTDLEAENDSLATANATLTGEKTTLTNEKTALSAKNDSLSTSNAKLAGEKTALATKNDSLATANATLAGEKASLTNEKTALSAKNDSLSTSNAKLAGEKTALATKNDSLSTANATLAGEKASLTNEKTALSAKNDSLTTSNAKLAGEKTALATKNDSLATANATLTSEKDALKADTTSLKAEIQTLNDRIEQLLMFNGHDYVDLGLSVMWATCNVGANAPEEYGDYFAWGEIEGYNSGRKTSFDWSTYKWCNGSSSTMTKYCTSNSDGTVDNKTQLDLADDAARANWGGNWRMPTVEEWDELDKNTTKKWTQVNGKSGYLLTSKVNGNSLFLPAAGCRYDGGISNEGSVGYYWSSSLYEYSSDVGRYLCFYSGDFNPWYNYYRYRGQSVRPVCPSAK